MPPKLDLKQQISDTDTTHAAALNLIDSAQRAQKAAADKCSKVTAPASLGASEASSAREIFRSVDEQQDALILAGLERPPSTSACSTTPPRSPRAPRAG